MVEFSHFIPRVDQQEVLNEAAVVEKRYRHLFLDKADWESVPQASHVMQEIRAGRVKEQMKRLYAKIDRERKQGGDFLRRIDLPRNQDRAFWTALLEGSMDEPDEYLPNPAVNHELQKGELMGTVCTRDIQPPKDAVDAKPHTLKIAGVMRDGQPTAVLLFSGEGKTRSHETHMRGGGGGGDYFRQPVPVTAEAEVGRRGR